MMKSGIETGERERRFVPLPTGRIEVRAEDEDARGIGGLAAIIGASTDLGPFTEEIAAGAFDEALEESDIRGLYNHDANFVLGRTKSGTMTVRATDAGLEYDIPDMPKSRADVMEAIERGDVDGNSFAFTVAEGGDRWIEEEDKKPHRVIERVAELFDVGPVAYPAYADAVVSARSLERAKRGAAEEVEAVETGSTGTVTADVVAAASADDGQPDAGAEPEPDPLAHHRRVVEALEAELD